MARKIDPALKVQLVKMYLRGEVSLKEATRRAGLTSRNPFRRWVRIYLDFGPVGFEKQNHQRHYPIEIKLCAVRAYLDGEGSLDAISKRFAIRSETQLSEWIKEYNTHGMLRSRTSKGDHHMGDTRRTTIEERLEIVRYCLSNDKDYAAAAARYHCSYQQVRHWGKRYEEMGSAGLEDRRGKRIGSMPARTEEEALRIKVADLERQNRRLQMELDFLKKLEELEKRDRCL